MLSLFSCVQLFATLWTVARQALLSMGFSMQEYWNGLPCPPPRDLPIPEIEPVSLMSPALTGGFITTTITWEARARPCCCSVTKLRLTLHSPTDCRTPGSFVPHHLPEFAQVHVQCIGDAIQPSHPLLPSSPSAFDPSQDLVDCISQAGLRSDVLQCCPVGDWKGMGEEASFLLCIFQGSS